MRWWILLTPALLVAACAPEETPETELNALPRVTAELNDGDPFENGATLVATISDADGELCSLEVEYSFDEGVTYAPATIPQHTAGNLAEVSCPEVGEKITMVWDLEGDLGGATAKNAILRFLPHDPEDAGPPAHLMIDLTAEKGTTIGGGFVTRDGAQGAQWNFQAVAMAHVLVTGEGASTTGEALFGTDDFDTDTYLWTYDLPTPPPDEHFQAMDWPGAEPGVGAFYLPLVFKDMDDSGALDAGEEIVGVAAQTMVAFIRPDGDWAHDDWYVIPFEPFVDPQMQLEFLPAETTIDLNLKGYSVFSGTLELDVANPTDVSSTRRLGVMPILLDPVVPADVVEVTSAVFNPEVPSVTLSLHEDMLSPAHWEDVEWNAFTEGGYIEALYLYLDADANEQVDEGESLTHRTGRGHDGAYLYLVHMEGAMLWDSLWKWALDDCWQGFNIVTPVEHDDDIFERWTCYPLDAPPQVGFFPM